MKAQQYKSPWSTTEWSQPAARTTNRSLLVACRAKAFPGRPTNSGSTLPRAAHLDGGVFGCHQCITSHSGNAPASPDMRPNPWLYPACIPFTTSIPAPTQPTITMTYYTHAPTVTNWDHPQAYVVIQQHMCRYTCQHTFQHTCQHTYQHTYWMVCADSCWTPTHTYG